MATGAIDCEPESLRSFEPKQSPWRRHSVWEISPELAVSDFAAHAQSGCLEKTSEFRRVLDVIHDVVAEQLLQSGNSVEVVVNS